MKKDLEDAVAVLGSGGVAVIPTDTLYGLVGLALNKDAVNKVYKLKNRSDGKPFIVLISSFEDLDKLKIHTDEKVRNFLYSVWPGPVSVVLRCEDDSLAYLHKGMGVAVRFPKQEGLLEILKQTGPLIAPSANPEGMKPAHTILEAKEYFGDTVDCYVDGGVLEGEPSTLVSFEDGELKVLRQGVIKIDI